MWSQEELYVLVSVIVVLKRTKNAQLVAAFSLVFWVIAYF